MLSDRFISSPYYILRLMDVRFKDGKGMEHWTYMQPADLMKMMRNNQRLNN